MSLSKPLTLRHLCHLLNHILGLFYHRHIVFFTITLVKNTKCYLPKKCAPEWPRNKLLATTCLVSKGPATLKPTYNQRDFSILPNPFLSLLRQLTLRGSGDIHPRKILKSRVPRMRFPAFSGEIFQKRSYFRWLHIVIAAPSISPRISSSHRDGPSAHWGDWAPLAPPPALVYATVYLIAQFTIRPP